jgi:hypothetical protein
MFKPYNDEIEERMQIFYESLSEKDRRRYAAIETLNYHMVVKAISVMCLDVMLKQSNKV